MCGIYVESVDLFLYLWLFAFPHYLHYLASESKVNEETYKILIKDSSYITVLSDWPT